MSIIDITYGKSGEIKQFEIPVLTLMKLNIAKLSIIKTLLSNTDSDIWLVEAEDNTFRELENG